MSLKSFGSSVSEIPTNLTSVADIEAMKSVEPVRDWLKEFHILMRIVINKNE